MAGPSEVNLGSEIEDFPGRSFNLLVREWYRQQGNLIRNPGSGNGPSHFTIVKAKNITGTTLQYGDCVALEGLAIAFDTKENQQFGRPLLKAQGHTSSLHHAVMGVSMRTVESDEPGPFITMGLAWVRCQVTDENHRFAALDEDQSSEFSPLAISAESGYPILDGEEVEPEYLPTTLWKCILIGGGGGGAINYRRCKVTAEVSAAIGWADSEAGEGEAVWISAGGQEEGAPFNVKSNYFREIQEGVPGWIYDDGSIKWIVNAGCDVGPEST